MPPTINFRRIRALKDIWTKKRIKQVDITGYQNLDVLYKKILNTCKKPTNEIVQGSSLYFGPGVYAIYCKKNQFIYFGESENVIYRVGMHMDELSKNRSRIAMLQKDWNQFGPQAFRFILLETGTKWSNGLWRRFTERKYINLRPERCYNVAYNLLKSNGTLLQKTMDSTSSNSSQSLTITNQTSVSLANTASDTVTPNKKINPPQPVTIGGQLYPSLSKASTALNVSRYLVKARLDKGLDPIVPTGRKKLTNSLGELITPNQNAKVTLQPSEYKVVFRGVLYNSTDEACAITKMSRSTVYRYLTEEIYQDSYYADAQGNRLERGPTRKQQFLIDGKKYKNIDAAIVGTGLSKYVIYRRCAATNLFYPNYSTFVE